MCWNNVFTIKPLHVNTGFVFSGYSSEDDMLLPASYFHRAFNCQSLSKFGRKKKHKIDPNVAQELPSKKRKTLSVLVLNATFIHL